MDIVFTGGKRRRRERTKRKKALKKDGGKWQEDVWSTSTLWTSFWIICKQHIKLHLNDSRAGEKQTIWKV